MLLIHQQRREQYPLSIDVALAFTEKVITLPATLKPRIRSMGGTQMAIAKSRITLNRKLKNLKHPLRRLLKSGLPTFLLNHELSAALRWNGYQLQKMLIFCYPQYPFPSGSIMSLIECISNLMQTSSDTYYIKLVASTL